MNRNDTMADASFSERTFPVPDVLAKTALTDRAGYLENHRRSIEDPEGFLTGVRLKNRLGAVPVRRYLNRMQEENQWAYRRSMWPPVDFDVQLPFKSSKYRSRDIPAVFMLLLMLSTLTLLVF